MQATTSTSLTSNDNRSAVLCLAQTLKLGRGEAHLGQPYGQSILWMGRGFSNVNEPLASANLAAKIACRIANRICSQGLGKNIFDERKLGSAQAALNALLTNATYQDHLTRNHPALKEFEARGLSETSASNPIANRLSAHFIALLTLLPQTEQKEFMQEAMSQAHEYGVEGADVKLRYQDACSMVAQRVVHTVIQMGVDDQMLRALLSAQLAPVLAQGSTGLTQLLARPTTPQLLYLNGLLMGYGQEGGEPHARTSVMANTLTMLLSQNHCFVVVGVEPEEESAWILEEALHGLAPESTPAIFWLSSYDLKQASPTLVAMVESGLVHWVQTQDIGSLLHDLCLALDSDTSNALAVPVKKQIPVYAQDGEIQRRVALKPASLADSSTALALAETGTGDSEATALDADAETKINLETQTQRKQSQQMGSPFAQPITMSEVEPAPTARPSGETLGIPLELDLDLTSTAPEIKEALVPVALNPKESATTVAVEQVSQNLSSVQNEEAALQRSHEWEMQADTMRQEGQESRSADILVHAVALYERAISELSETSPSTELSRLHKKIGETYFLLCGSTHNADHLKAAVASYRSSMQYSNKHKSPYVWSDTQHKLGLALASLGELSSSATTVREAIAAYEAALEVRSLDETPADWACTQNFLGIALSTIGAQESQIDTLVQSVAAYQAALLGYTKESDPVDWAGVQNNLGAALANLGERTGETYYLEMATKAFEGALSVISKESMPQDWAMTQSNLAHALAGLGKNSSNLGALEKAITAYEKVLEVRQLEHDPIDWAMTQNNLGHALHSYSEQSNDSEVASRAVQAFRATLKAISRSDYPLDWAATQNNLGNALQSLSEQTNDIEALRQAVDAYEAALEVRKEDLHPIEWAGTQGNLAHALQTLSDKTQDNDLLRRTIIAYKSALSKIDAQSMPINWTVLQNNLGTALRILGERQRSTELIKAAIAAYTAAQPFFETAGVGPYVDMVRKNLDLARGSLAQLQT